MRSPSYQRRVRARDLRINIRDDIKDPAEESDFSDSEDEPDTPSPTTGTFPAPDTITQPAPEVQPTAAQPSTVTGPDSSTPTTLTTAIGVSPSQESSISTGDGQDPQPQNDQAQLLGTGDNENDSPSSDAVIAFGTIGGVVILGAICFVLWKFWWRRKRTGKANVAWLSPFSKYRKMEEPRQQSNMKGDGPGTKTESKIMDDLMAAAYAAEDGNGRQTYDGYANEKQNINQPPMTIPAAGGRGSDLYVSQVVSGFYKAPQTNGLTMPPNARMPPRPPPSIAAETEVTNSTETTWRTWGVSQDKKPKENWVDKCIRLGGTK
ncbi:hypothetical protein F4779DRAFT_616525 [Xylariaceae sp. FL0662B]|nr:hypothetical protein F4779DRAFT_616525 [Xylariaceae sp. FL0662B]